jgi:hypothetical protein
MWFSGRPLSRAGNSDDGYITTPNYVAKFNQGLQKYSGPDGVAAINAAANIKPKAPGALSMAYADPNNPGALSPQPGALTAAGTIAIPGTDDPANVIGRGLTGMGAALAGISSPAQAQALTQQAALMQKANNEWTVAKVDKNGNALMVNKTGQYRVVRTPLGADELTPGEAEAQKLQAKAARDRYDTITAADSSADEKLRRLDQLEPLLNNPNVYQGGGANEMLNAKNIAQGLGINVSGVPESQQAQAIMTQLQLEKGKMLPGAISNYEDQLMAKANGFNLSNQKEANIAAIQAQRDLLQYQKGIASQYRAYKGSLKDGALPGDEWDQIQADYRRSYEKAHPVETMAPAAGKPALPKGVNSIKIVQ